MVPNKIAYYKRTQHRYCWGRPFDVVNKKKYDINEIYNANEILAHLRLVRERIVYCRDLHRVSLSHRTSERHSHTYHILKTLVYIAAKNNRITGNSSRSK